MTPSGYMTSDCMSEEFSRMTLRLGFIPPADLYLLVSRSWTPLQVAVVIYVQLSRDKPLRWLPYLLLPVQRASGSLAQMLK